MLGRWTSRASVHRAGRFVLGHNLERTRFQANAGLGIPSDGTLEFRAACKRELILPQCPDYEGFVSAAIGKWHRPDEIAEWLCQHCSRWLGTPATVFVTTRMFFCGMHVVVEAWNRPPCRWYQTRRRPP